MSKTLKTSKFKLMPLWASFIICVASILSLSAQKKENSIKMTKNPDGSYSETETSDDNRTIYRRTYGKETNGNGEKKLRMYVVYRKDNHGRLRNGTVSNGDGKVLYRVKYGYHRVTGKLVKEHMFDAQVKRTRVQIGPDGKPIEVEYPVRTLDHRYDAQGREMKPICFCMPAGKTAEELFGVGKSSHLDKM